MMNKHFFEIVMMLLASSTGFSLEQKPVLFQQRRVNRASFKLLTQLQTSSIQQCLPHRRNFLLPQQSVTAHQYQTGHTLAILHETLQQVFNLFWANISLDGWEESQLEKFLTELHQHLEYLDVLMGRQAEQKGGPGDSESLRLPVKMYFRRIRDYLESQEYSSCAWIIVQAEINRCLFFVFQLTGKLSKQEMDP